MSLPDAYYSSEVGLWLRLHCSGPVVGYSSLILIFAPGKAGLGKDGR
jgi:hypothetical protein